MGGLADGGGVVSVHFFWSGGEIALRFPPLQAVHFQKISGVRGRVLKRRFRTAMQASSFFFFFFFFSFFARLSFDFVLAFLGIGRIDQLMH
jgi:hypothetical protein